MKCNAIKFTYGNDLLHYHISEMELFLRYPPPPNARVVSAEPALNVLFCIRTDNAYLILWPASNEIM